MIPKVVIVGAGFGGLQCARRLAGQPVEVLLIDRNNFHLFTPLLYQVASSLLDPSDIAYPIRRALRRARNVRVRVAEVTEVDLAGQVVATRDGARHPYDYLVLATGSATNFFGLERIQPVAHGLKDLPEALALRNHSLRCLEAASAAADPAARAAWLTFVVVGGGPTGVEYAGALAELVRLVLPYEYPELDPAAVRLVLIELAPQLLPAFPEALGREAEAVLRRRGVELRLGTRVIDATGDGVVLAAGERVAARTLVWAAGVKPSGIGLPGAAPRRRSGRLEVDATLRLTGWPSVFAIGDLAGVVQDGVEIPMLAPPAMQEGRFVANAILRLARGAPLGNFRYCDKGTMATIGRNAAVARTAGLSLTGFVGWVAWLVLHLYFLIGFRNRIAVLLRWAWNYLFYDRPVRIIVRANEA